MLESHLDGCEQGARFTGLRQVADNAIAQRANSIAVVGKSRNQDGWNRMTHLQKTVMQLEPGHAGHMDISDQAAGSADIGLRQEFGRGSESDNGVPPGFHEAGQSLTNIRIVVDNRDQGLCTQSDLLPALECSTVMAVQTLRQAYRQAILKAWQCYTSGQVVVPCGQCHDLQRT